MAKTKEAKKPMVKEVEKEVEMVEVDRSAYNCPECKGEGLVMHGTAYKTCERCLATGKV